MNGSRYESLWRRSTLMAAALGLAVVAMSPAASAQDAAGPDDAAQAANQDRPRRARGQGGGGGQDPVRTVEQLRQQVNALTLKPDQKTKLDALFTESLEQAKSLQTEVQSLERRERAQKLQPFGRTLREKVLAALDEEQRQTLRRNSATRQGRQTTERWKRALGQLSLSADQQTKVDAVRADAQKQIETRATEAPAERPADPSADGGGRRGAGGGRTAGLTRETRQKIEEILTAEQRTKLAEVMPQGRRRGGRGAGNQQQ